MKSKPVVLEHLRMVHESITINFIFENNITILTGLAGTGKTMAFSFIKECEASKSDILCLNYMNPLEEIENKISESKGKLIVIDNADVVLTDKIRKYISLDDKNQYLIIGRNPENLFTTSDNLYELVRKKNGEQTEFRIERYL